VRLSGLLVNTPSPVGEYHSRTILDGGSLPLRPPSRAASCWRPISARSPGTGFFRPGRDVQGSSGNRFALRWKSLGKNRIRQDRRCRAQVSSGARAPRSSSPPVPVDTFSAAPHPVDEASHLRDDELQRFAFRSVWCVINEYLLKKSDRRMQGIDEKSGSRVGRDSE
jgi:hypothetical protein